VELVLVLVWSLALTVGALRVVGGMGGGGEVAAAATAAVAAWDWPWLSCWLCCFGSKLGSCEDGGKACCAGVCCVCPGSGSMGGAGGGGSKWPGLLFVGVGRKGMDPWCNCVKGGGGPARLGSASKWGWGAGWYPNWGKAGCR